MRARLDIEKSASQLNNFLGATTQLMKVIARACGHNALSEFSINDLSTFSYDIHRLTGIPFAGVRPYPNVN